MESLADSEKAVSVKVSAPGMEAAVAGGGDVTVVGDGEVTVVGGGGLDAADKVSPAVTVRFCHSGGEGRGGEGEGGGGEGAGGDGEGGGGVGEGEGGGGEGKGGDGDGEGGGGKGVVVEGTDMNWSGETTLPQLPSITKASVLARLTVLPLEVKLKARVSPPTSAPMMICQIDWPAYGPKGVFHGVGC